MLRINNISFGYYPNRLIFDRVHLDLKPGEVIGLYGSSGIGKTTFAKIAAGYLKADQGTVVVDGETYPFKGRNPVQLIGQHPEKAINPRWQMKQVLAESGKFNAEFLCELGINKEWMHRYPSQLSAGELQRFCLARAIVPETRYLIADEMTTMLDAIAKAQIWQTVLQLVKQRQLGMLVISHELSLLNKTCCHIHDFKDLIGKRSGF